MSEAPGDRRVSALEHPALAIALIAAGWLVTAGALGLLEPTETRFGEIAREMLASGDWLAPRLDGIHHFHKPPLAYWAAAGGMSLFGVGAFGARLGVVLAAMTTLAATAWTARRFASLAIGPGRAVWMLASMLLFAVVGRALSTDPFLAAAVALYWALAPSAWALGALGIGFMAKGPVVFVHTALPVLAVAALTRDRRALRWLGPPFGWWIFAALALPWYLTVVATHRGLLGYFLGNQLWERYATTVHRRAEPVWYFLAVLLGGGLPWTGAMIAGLARTWRERTVESRMLIGWLIAPVVFLSFSGSKLPAYLLPCLPAAALLAARGIDSRGARAVAVLALVAIALTGLFAGARQLAGPEARGAVASLPPLAVVSCVIAGLAGLAAARGEIAWTGCLVSGALVTACLALSPFESTLGSPRRITELLVEQRARTEPVVLIGHFNAGLPFYLRRTVPMLEVPREPGFEDSTSLAAAIVPRDSIAAWSRRDGRVWTFGPADHTRDVAQALGLGYVTIARWRAESLGFLSAGH